MVVSPTTLHIGRPCHTIHSQGLYRTLLLRCSAFLGQMAEPGFAACPYWGTLDVWLPPSSALSLAPSHVLEGL